MHMIYAQADPEVISPEEFDVDPVTRLFGVDGCGDIGLRTMCGENRNFGLDNRDKQQV